MSGTVDKLKAKVEGVLHKDNDNTTTGNTHHTGTAGHHTGTTGTTGTTGHHTGTTGTTGGYSDPTGPHDSRLGNKADPRVDSDLPGGAGNTRGAGGYGGSDPTGPHNTRLANQADPRVDSDRVGEYGNTTGAGGYGTGHGTHTGGTHHTTGGFGGSDPTGPHDSRLANKADPRVDSDRIGDYGNSRSVGGTGHSTGAHNTTGTTTGGYSDPTGPHDSRLGNKVDPRVDSDQVGGYGNTTGAGGYGTGHGTHTGGTHHTTGGYGGSDPTGPHDSRLGNKADPRVDSDRYGPAGNTAGARDTTGTGYGSGTTTGYGTGTGAGVGAGQHTGQHHGQHHGHSGPGPAENTAGPHKSDLLNKLDPRVDSDLDGSKTTGGNKTYSG